MVRSGFGTFATLTATGLAVLALLTSASSARATCSGPCLEPEMKHVLQVDGQPTVLTNFGLLSDAGSSFHLVCEESMGGLLLDLKADSGGVYASTSGGLTRRAEDQCTWTSAHAGATTDWFLDFTLPSLPGGAPAAERFALGVATFSKDLHVQRAVGTDAFETVKEFAPASGYRTLVSGGDPAHVYVSGYTFLPRTWNLAISEDNGDTWREVSPDVDNTVATMVLLGIDPEHPEHLLLKRQIDVTARELWRFNAATDNAELLFSVAEDETIVDLVMNGNTWVLAASNGATGTLYQSDDSGETFRVLQEDGPPYACFSQVNAAWYACVNDYSRDSDFIVGVSEDSGASWEPWLTVADLGRIRACEGPCTLTLNWLVASYGVLSAVPPGDSDAGATPGTGVQDAGTGSDAGTGPETPPAPIQPSFGCDCAVGTRSSSPSAGLLFGALLLLGWSRLRRAP